MNKNGYFEKEYFDDGDKRFLEYPYAM